MADIPHYKSLRGELTFEEVQLILTKITMIDNHRDAVYNYFVHGKTVDKLRVSTVRILPILQKVNEAYHKVTANNYLNRFLYTNDFNPSAR